MQGRLLNRVELNLALGIAGNARGGNGTLPQVMLEQIHLSHVATAFADLVVVHPVTSSVLLVLVVYRHEAPVCDQDEAAEHEHSGIQLKVAIELVVLDRTPVDTIDSDRVGESDFLRTLVRDPQDRELLWLLLLAGFGRVCSGSMARVKEIEVFRVLANVYAGLLCRDICEEAQIFTFDVDLDFAIPTQDQRYLHMQGIAG